ncbi:MAG: hypothetical protein ABI053_00770 [Lacisediminihabitans sp.]
MKKLLAVCTTALQALGLARGGNSAPRHAHKRVRITKPLAVVTTALLATGLAVVGVAAPASAHNQSVTSTCSVLTVNLTNYQATVPGSDTTYKTIPNPAYVPASSTTTYQRYSWTGGNQSTAPTEVPPSQNWQANTDNYDGAGHGTDPVNSPFKGNSGDWFYWTGTVTVTPAVGTPTIQVVDHQGTAQKTNHVKVTIDGAATPVADTDFSTSYNNTFNFANSNESHNWVVTVTAWDDLDGVNGWTKTITGSSTACVTPPVITPKVCSITSTMPTSTNLDQHGWVLKAGTATYVAGGVQLTSTNWDGGKVTLSTNFPLSEAGAAAIDYTQGPGSGSVAILFNTSDGNQIHYEPFAGYTHPWFADNAGVFPLGGGGQGSAYSSVDLNGMLSNPTVTSVVVGVWGETSDVVTVHSATFNCATQPFDYAIPAAQVCTATGAPYTEDGFPVFNSEGQEYLGGSGHALNWLVPTSGNLQGITSVGYTISAATGYQAAYRFVLYANGTSGYTSVTAEPYMNGWVAGQTGTFTIGQSTLVWNSHISSGPGSQSQPVTIAAMAALIPNNQLISQGIHLGSTAGEGQNTTVSSITGCASFAAPSQPPATTRQVVKKKAPVCTVNEDGTFPGGGTIKVVTRNYQTPFVWSQDSQSYVPGTEVQVGKKIVTFEDATATQCPTSVVIATDPEVVQPQCVIGEGDATVNSGYITIAVTPNVKYSITGTTDDNVAVNLTDVGAQTELAPGTYTVSATADSGYVLAENDGPWIRTITAFEGNCDLVTLAPIPTAVTSTDQVCTTGDATGGTITVGQVIGEGGSTDFFGAGVDYFINGTKVTSKTTTVPAGTYKVTAVADPAGDASVDGESAWTITVAAPASCPQLTTLAFTGVDGNMSGMLIIALFLLLGGAGAVTASRLRSRES